MLGYIVFWLGELDLARTHLEQSVALYDTQQHRTLAFVYGVSDPGVRCLAVSAHVLLLLGYPDQALQWSHAALSLAQELAYSFSLGYALTVAAMQQQLRREAALTQGRESHRCVRA